MIKFGVIGTSTIVDRFISGARRDKRFVLKAVYSRSVENAKAFAKKYSLRHVFTDMEEMAASRNIDAVYVASPNAFHAAHALRFLHNDKHVLCEKAIASNLSELQIMKSAAENSGQVLMEAMKTTLLPNFEQVRRLLPEIGTIRHYTASYCQYSSRYDRFKAGIVENAFKPELSNGALMDIGVYCIYPMVSWFGSPKAVIADTIKLSNGVDGEGCIICRYPKFLATLSYSKISDSFLPSEIQGERGNILIKNINTFEEVTLAMKNEGEKNFSLPQIKNDMYYEVKEFIDVIEDHRRQSYINSLDTSVEVMKIMDEVRRQTGIIFPADNQ